MHPHLRPDDVSRFARAVVAKRALVLIGVAGVCHLLVLTGVLPDSVGEQAQVVTVSIIDAVAAVGGIFWIQSGTTPADPKLQPVSTNGRPLVEEHASNVRRVEREDLRASLDPEAGQTWP